MLLWHVFLIIAICNLPWNVWRFLCFLVCIINLTVQVNQWKVEPVCRQCRQKDIASSSLTSSCHRFHYSPEEFHVRIVRSIHMTLCNRTETLVSCENISDADLKSVTVKPWCSFVDLSVLAMGGKYQVPIKECFPMLGALKKGWLTVCTRQSSGAVWKSRWPSWTLRPY